MKSKNARVKIPIPENVLLLWKNKYKHGDLSAIANQVGAKHRVNRPQIERAWLTGETFENVISAIVEFYELREQRIKSVADKFQKATA